MVERRKNDLASIRERRMLKGKIFRWAREERKAEKIKNTVHIGAHMELEALTENEEEDKVRETL